MHIHKYEERACIILALTGEVDALSAIQLDDEVKTSIEGYKHDLVIDCKSLAYISSAGLGVFLSYIKDMEENSKEMVLCSLNESVYATFEILGLHHLIKIVPTKEEALNLCQKKTT